MSARPPESLPGSEILMTIQGEKHNFEQFAEKLHFTRHIPGNNPTLILAGSRNGSNLPWMV
jgi:hypothetical protein